MFSLLRPFRLAARSYPPQFWLLFWGQIISTIGASMIWPFLMIYVSGRLTLPLTAVASLMTLNAAWGLIFSFVAGPAADTLGRKWVMVISLAVNGIGYLFMSRAETFAQFALLMSLSGAFNPLFRVGADAMMADLIPPHERADAYSLLRMSNNVGVALGPAVGGFIASSSYTVAFFCAAAGMITYSLLLVLRAHETLPKKAVPVKVGDAFAGYGRIFRDKPFIAFTLTFTLTQMCASLIWVLMAVYAKQNYGVMESQYGFIPTTNALMVVFLQIAVTRITKRHPPLKALAVGSIFYAIGVGSVAFGRNFWGFWFSMVIISIGELILIPTSTTYAANQAPSEYRGRYMSVYGLTWGVATGIAPVLGGFLSDNLGPKTTWYGGFLIGLASVIGFLVLSRVFPPRREQPLVVQPAIEESAE
ncbi:MAG: MFS transporter [Chloroflexi bacterium]|nr:MFS transporter [Chloroflexota bacterium]